MTDLSPALHRFGDVSVRLSVELGRTDMALRDVLSLGQGSVVALDRLTDELLDITANGKVIAQGEVIAEDGRFALRIVNLVGEEYSAAPPPRPAPRPAAVPPPKPTAQPVPQPAAEPAPMSEPEPQPQNAPQPQDDPKPESAPEAAIQSDLPAADAPAGEEIDDLMDALSELDSGTGEDAS
ncbi:MAG: flagellar motor switch protein FliN [Pseudomonadota bacterium]